MNLTERQRQTLVWAVVGLLILAVLVSLGPIVTPFIAAAILAYVLEPAVKWLVRLKTPRWLATTLVLIITVFTVLSILLIIVPIVQRESTLIRAQLPNLVASITGKLLPWVSQHLGIDLKIDSASIKDWLAKQLTNSGEDVLAIVLAYLKSGWGAAVQVLGLAFLVPVVVAYLLIDWPTITKRLHDLIPLRWRTTVDGTLSEIDDLLGHYLRGQLLVMLCLAVYYSLGLAIARFDLWLPIGVLTGLLVAIPYIGFALGLLFALIAGMLQLGPLYGFVAVAIVYGLGQLLESLVLTPRLIGERIGLHPLAVIFSLLAFGSLLGFTGVLLALPLAAVAAVGLRRLHKQYIKSDFYARDTL
jgi:predicted PurR-regulated permease PerM